MKEKYLYAICILAIIFVIFTTGCVTPPQENTQNITYKTGTKIVTKQPTYYVTVVTTQQNASPAIQTQGYSTFLPTTEIPEDMTCSIYSVSLSGFNQSGLIFDLKNPPMYINWTVVPKNVTVNKVYTDANTKKTVTLQYSDFSPNSWFVVTVRDNANKEVILQEGFGESKGYSIYLKRTMKILKTGEILVEFDSHDMKSASATIWVKPRENFNESRLSEFRTCMYWDEYRNVLSMPTQTSVTTWTPENVYKPTGTKAILQGTQPTVNKSQYY